MARNRHLSAARSHDGVRPGHRGGGHVRGWPLVLRAAAAALLLLGQVSLAATQEVTAEPPSQPEWLGTIPARIDIPKIGTHAEIVPLGMDEDGAMSSPTDPDTVGWYEPGPGVGGPGNMLLDGHVDWGGTLRVFGLLRTLEPGDEIRVTDADGGEKVYGVEWVRLYVAAEAPLEEIFTLEPQEALTLITCGGEFDHDTRMYVSRWVVRAMPVPTELMTTPFSAD